MSFLQKKSGDGAKRFYYRRFGQSQSEGALPYREKRSDREQRLFRNLRLASYPACVLFASHLALSVARSFLFFFHSLFPISRSARARQERALRPWCCIARGTIQVDQRREEEARLEPEEPVSGQHQLQWQSPRFHPSLDPRSQTGSGCGLCCPSLRHLVNKWLSVCILLVILFFHFHLLSVAVFHCRSEVKKFLNATCPKKVNKLHVFISMAEIDSSIFLEGGGGNVLTLGTKTVPFYFLLYIYLSNTGLRAWHFSLKRRTKGGTRWKGRSKKRFRARQLV